MSIQSELSRIVNAKQDIYNYLNSKNVFVPNYVTFEEYPKYINLVRFSSSASSENSVTIYNGNNIVGMCILDNISTSPSFYNYQNTITEISVGNLVTNMSEAFMSCANLTGNAACGDNVINMYGAYRACGQLTGPAVCGPNVVNMVYAYQYCVSIGGNAYFYSPNVSNAVNCFNGKNNSRLLNIYVPANSTTFNTVTKSATSPFQARRNSITGAPITFTNNGICSYNTRSNIYVYPVDNVAAARAANND